MADKDVKNLLKDARKLVDEKNYKEAQECCKNILRKDKQNYLGLVLLGKSLNDSEQAPLAFQKAIASKPDHPLAWQGLANYYEKNEDNGNNKEKLFKIYEEILKLQIEKEKAVEIITKLGQLGGLLKNGNSINILADFLLKNEDVELHNTAKNQLMELLNSGVPCHADSISLVLKVLNKIYEKQPSEGLELVQAKLIMQSSDFASAVQEIVNLMFFPMNLKLREWLCAYICQKYVEENSFCNLDIEKVIDTITQGLETSKSTQLLKSIISYDKGMYLEAYKQSVSFINFNEANETDAIFLLNCTLKLKKWQLSEKIAINFLNKSRNESLNNKLKKILFIALFRQQKWKSAIDAVKNLELTNLSMFEKACFAECYLQMGQTADTLLEDLKSTEYYTPLKALSYINTGKHPEVISLLEGCDENNAMNLFYLGRTYWELQQYDESHMYLLKAAKCNAEDPDTFLYLGHFYSSYKKDLNKARKCYEKAYDLNNANSKISKYLSDIYSKLDLKDADFELLCDVEKQFSNEPWINFKLGLHYVNKREWDKAITCFRNVIKSKSSGMAITALECLADAYYSRGSYTSSLRAYNKVMTLDPKRTIHCLMRTGYIHCVLTQYEDAIATFKKVLDIDSSSVLALKGLAETYIKIAKKKATAKLFGSSRDYAQMAIDLLSIAISLKNQYICLIKHLADTLMFITKLPNKYVFVYIKNSANDDKATFKSKMEIYPQAIAFYCQIAKHKDEVSSFNLSSAYFEYFCASKVQNNCRVAFNLTVSCVKRKPSSWRNWNLLGKICLFVNKYNIAQHCFIKALSVTRKHSMAMIWCNLGTLYLKLKLYKMANHCYWRGQSTLPSYPHSWIGQAFIAEAIQEEEAMDLFRHASRLGYHPESALGYADWVCRTLYNDKYKTDAESRYVIEGLYAIPYTIDLMEWYLSFEDKDPCAYTIIGILQERSGLLNSALQSYEKALTYARDQNKNIARLNLGRILLRVGRYDGAIKSFTDITEACLDSTGGMALSLFKKGVYEDSYNTYSIALQWLSNDDDEKADLLVAMAGIIYMFKGVEDAKTLLFQSNQVSKEKPTAYSLFSICCLGFLNSDLILAEDALKKLDTYEKFDTFGFDIGFLRSYLHICNGFMEMAIKSLSDSLHEHPSNPLLWFCMAQYCLSEKSTRARVASCCAQRAICSARYSDCKCNPAKMLATASIAEVMSGDNKKGLYLAKEGLHMYPHNSEVWASLLYSLISQSIWTQKQEWVLVAAGHMRRHLDIPRPLSRWVSLIEKKLVK